MKSAPRHEKSPGQLCQPGLLDLPEGKIGRLPLEYREALPHHVLVEDGYEFIGARIHGGAHFTIVARDVNRLSTIGTRNPQQDQEMGEPPCHRQANPDIRHVVSSCHCLCLP